MLRLGEIFDLLKIMFNVEKSTFCIQFSWKSTKQWTQKFPSASLNRSGLSSRYADLNFYIIVIDKRTLCVVCNSHEVPVPAAHDLLSLKAGNGTLWEEKSILFSQHQCR